MPAQDRTGLGFGPWSCSRIPWMNPGPLSCLSISLSLFFFFLNTYLSIWLCGVSVWHRASLVGASGSVVVARASLLHST